MRITIHHYWKRSICLKKRLFSCIFGSKPDSFWLNLAWGLFHILVSFWVDPSTTAWEKGLVSVIWVLVECWRHLPGRPLSLQITLYKTLTFATSASPESLNVLLKIFTQLVDGRKGRIAPNTPDPLCAKGARHLTCFAQNSSNQRSPHRWQRLSLKFGIFICDRNSSTCQKNRARTNLLKQDEN